MILLLIPAVISAPIDVIDAAGPHHEHLLTQPIPDISERAARSAPPSATAGPDVWVYGYYPYWVDGMEDLAWDELSHIALFNVNLESDGTVSDTDNWHDMAPTAMALAEPYGVKVHLTLTCFDGDVMASVLPSTSKRATLVDELADLVDTYGAHGVSVDCEGMSSTHKSQLVSLVEELKERVDEVTVATPAIDWLGAYDYDALANASDGLFIMGYGYHWSGGDPGPLAPLYGGSPWSDYSLDWSVDDYLYYGAPADKIILGLPLYGRDWPTTSNSVPGSATGTGSSIVISSAISEAATFGRLYDTVTDTPYYFPDSVSQVWYDDNTSVREKISYAVDQNLLGVGFWALQYEGGDPDFWEMVREETHTEDGSNEGSDDTGLDANSSDDTGLTETSDLDADAGLDLLAYVGDTVILDGYGEGADSLVYTWTQVAGPAVDLEASDTPQPQFKVSDAGNLIFELVVSADDDTSAPDTVTVVVARLDAGTAFESGCGCTANASPSKKFGFLLIGLVAVFYRRRSALL